jgi:hypothetical protein
MSVRMRTWRRLQWRMRTSVNHFWRNSGEIRKILEFRAQRLIREKISRPQFGISLEFQDAESEFHPEFHPEFHGRVEVI